MNFECDRYFHVYTRANSEKDQLFVDHNNYIFFLKRYKKYIAPVFETLCYCLIPNHYHLLVKVKTSEEIYAYQKKKKYKYYNDELKINVFLQQQFANFHISYAKAFNKKYDRRGTLFQPKPKAKEISDINSCLRVCRYIHRNPIKHGLANMLVDWEYSSFQDYAGARKETVLHKELILSQFGTIEEFIEYCSLEIDDYEMSF
jgi:REP-associated tyrosine transposase